MQIKVMKKGEQFVGIQDGWIVLKRKRGDVRLIRIEQDEEGYRVIPGQEILITYGDNEVSIGNMDTEVEITNF